MARKFVILSLLSVLSMGAIVTGCGIQNKTVAIDEKYPAKPITIIVPYVAGGSTDMMARMMEKTARKHLGQPLIISNIPGGAGTIGWNELAGAKPDGYTIGAIGVGINLQPLYGPTRYHYPTALEPIAQVVSTPVVLAVREDQPCKNINELIDYTKKYPNEIKYSNTGFGSLTNVVGEFFTKKAGLNIVEVSFRGEAEGLTALLGGHVQALFTAYPATIEHVKSGTVRVLAVAAEQRLTNPELANVPTFKEEGFDIAFTMWQGIAAPKGLPEDVKSKLSKGLKGIISDTEFIKGMESLGMQVEYLDSKKFGERCMNDSVQVTQIVKDTGIADRIAAQKK